MTGTIDVFVYLDTALLDERLRLRATDVFLNHAPAALGVSPRNGLRGSDAGGCVAAIWSDIHNQVAPPDALTQLYKFDGGSLRGLWVAALIKTGWEAIEPNGWAALEVESAYGGVKSHADVVLGHTETGIPVEYDRPDLVVEIKHTDWTGAYEAPGSRKKDGTIHNPYQVLQAAQQALGIEAPAFCIATFAPAARNREDRRGQSHYTVDDEMRALVVAELARQQAALAPNMPVGDPQESWRCRLCDSTACNRSPQYVAPVSVSF